MFRISEARTPPRLAFPGAHIFFCIPRRGPASRLHSPPLGCIPRRGPASRLHSPPLGCVPCRDLRSLPAAWVHAIAGRVRGVRSGVPWLDSRPGRHLGFVVPGLIPGNHWNGPAGFGRPPPPPDWIAGTSPAMTKREEPRRERLAARARIIAGRVRGVRSGVPGLDPRPGGRHPKVAFKAPDSRWLWRPVRRSACGPGRAERRRPPPSPGRWRDRPEPSPPPTRRWADNRPRP